jgi:hypothetical protein
LLSGSCCCCSLAAESLSSITAVRSLYNIAPCLLYPFVLMTW